VEAPERVVLEGLESPLAGGQSDVAEAALALLSGREVELDEDELRGARRRSVQLLAAGGNPLRDLDVDGRAVRALADDLDTPERRASLARGLEELRASAQGLPHVLEQIDGLVQDPDLAWRWFACTVLAEELSED
jgi:hypothetical protein